MEIIFTLTEITKALSLSGLETSQTCLAVRLWRDDRFPPGPKGRGVPRFSFDEALEIWLLVGCISAGLEPAQAKEISDQLKTCFEAQLNAIPPGWPQDLPLQKNFYSPLEHWRGLARVEIHENEITCFAPAADKTPGPGVFIFDLNQARWGKFAAVLCRFLHNRAANDFTNGNFEGGRFYLEQALRLGVRPVDEQLLINNPQEEK